jgi:hypothetical protein
LESKHRQKEEAMHVEDTQRLVAEEIEMLKVVLHLMVCCRSEEDYLCMHILSLPFFCPT